VSKDAVLKWPFRGPGESVDGRAIARCADYDYAYRILFQLAQTYVKCSAFGLCGGGAPRLRVRSMRLCSNCVGG